MLFYLVLLVCLYFNLSIDILIEKSTENQASRLAFTSGVIIIINPCTTGLFIMSCRGWYFCLSSTQPLNCMFVKTKVKTIPLAMQGLIPNGFLCVSGAVFMWWIFSYMFFIFQSLEDRVCYTTHKSCTLFLFEEHLDKMNLTVSQLIKSLSEIGNEACVSVIRKAFDGKAFERDAVLSTCLLNFSKCCFYLNHTSN